MIQKEKSLLMKELCARLPYGTKLDFGSLGIRTLEPYYLDQFDSYEFIKPYLRSLSSMTKEEKKHLVTDFWGSHTCLDAIEELDWYLERRFDVRGLIKKGQKPMNWISKCLVVSLFILIVKTL